jgi:hypothetical protein
MIKSKTESLKLSFFIACIFIIPFLRSQVSKDSKIPYYFGFQLKPLFPTKFIGESNSTFSNQGYEVNISQQVGISYGGVVRIALTDLIGIETGLNFFQRYFKLDMRLIDSNIVASDKFGFIQYDLPINALFYAKLNKKWFMNAAIGASICYKPSNVGTISNTKGKHEFFNIGIVDINDKVNLDLNGNLGFEFRTDKYGFFYLGGCARIPTAPLFNLLSRYRYGTFEVNNYGPVSGSFLAIELKYFIPNNGGNGQQFEHGPIE